MSRGVGELRAIAEAPRVMLGLVPSTHVFFLLPLREKVARRSRDG